MMNQSWNMCRCFLWGTYIASDDDDRWMYGSCTVKPVTPTMVPLVEKVPEMPFNPELKMSPVVRMEPASGSEGAKGKERQKDFCISSMIWDCIFQCYSIICSSPDGFSLWGFLHQLGRGEDSIGFEFFFPVLVCEMVVEQCRAGCRLSGLSGCHLRWDAIWCLSFLSS